MPANSSQLPSIWSIWQYLCFHRPSVRYRHIRLTKCGTNQKNTNCMEKGIIEWENIAIEMINRNQPGNVQSCVSVRCWFEHVAEQFSSWKVVDIFRIRWYLFIVYLLVLPFTSQNVTAHTQSHKSIPEHTQIAEISGISVALASMFKNRLISSIQCNSNGQKRLNIYKYLWNLQFDNGYVRVRLPSRCDQMNWETKFIHCVQFGI